MGTRAGTELACAAYVTCVGSFVGVDVRLAMVYSLCVYSRSMLVCNVVYSTMVGVAANLPVASM